MVSSRFLADPDGLFAVLPSLSLPVALVGRKLHHERRVVFIVDPGAGATCELCDTLGFTVLVVENWTAAASSINQHSSSVFLLPRLFLQLASVDTAR